MFDSTTMCGALRTLTILVLWLSTVWCVSPQSQQQQHPRNSYVAKEMANSTSTLQVLSQLTEKILTKLNTHLFAPSQRAKARSYDWSYMDGYSHDVYGKSDYSWIIPLIIVVGFGTLLIPLMGTLMTTMITQGTINLTAGRRRRRNASNDGPNNSGINWHSILTSVEQAITKFGKHF